MIGYITIGARDSEESGLFYDAILFPCGYERKFSDGGWVGYGPAGKDEHNVYICPPHNRQPASFGNGMMVAFRTRSRASVDAAYHAGLSSGGTDEGAPGYRPPEKQSWYGAYLRDPVGNKIAIYFAP
ncbi:MAG TPA: VOC family protein [Rhizomicrobium sp.]